FRADGGMLFITGEGLDAVVIVYPYRNLVAETVLAGRAPGAMAVSTTAPDLLFVASPQSGDVTLMDITTSKIRGAVAVGAEPGHITVTPDDQYALVLNRRSGDMAVIWLAALRDKRTRTAPPPLLTTIRVGSKPVSAAVRRA
ncbi:MAG: YncE family protein, partial [Bryobacteraceae bacterium]